MRKLVTIAAGGAVLYVAVVLPTTLHAAVGRSLAAAIEATDPVEKAGCYRLGETGYHWYRFCFGPAWLYPHQRVAWSMVSLGKLSSWFLLLIISYAMVAAVNRPAPYRRQGPALPPEIEGRAGGHA